MTTDHIITNTELIKIVKQMLDMALDQPGVTDAAAGGSSSVGLNASVRLGEVEVIEFNRDKSIGITVYKGQRKGTVSITDLSPAAIKEAIQAASRIADFTEGDPCAGLPDKDQLATNIPDLDLHHLAHVTPEQAIDNAKQCEAAALDYSKEITNSEGASFGTSDQFYVYGNTRGFLGSYATTRYNAYCVAIGQRGDSMQRDYDFTVARDIKDLLSLKKVGINAAKKTIGRLGAKKISTRQAPVMLIPKIATSFWGTLIAAISGSNLFRKSSFLLDCIDTQIFPTFMQINEQPFILKGLGSAPFDDEGVATRQKDVIKEGVLNSYILSTYSARKLGMQTTGNAGGIHNLFVTPSNLDFTQMLQQMGTGLLVTSLMGDGTNIVTGDYSHGAAGFWVENGEITYPVEEITIAGNLRDLFANLVACGNDLDYRANIITGSVLLEKMTIAGN